MLKVRFALGAITIVSLITRWKDKYRTRNARQSDRDDIDTYYALKRQEAELTNTIESIIGDLTAIESRKANEDTRRALSEKLEEFVNERDYVRCELQNHTRAMAYHGIPIPVR